MDGGVLQLGPALLSQRLAGAVLTARLVGGSCPDGGEGVCEGGHRGNCRCWLPDLGRGAHAGPCLLEVCLHRHRFPTVE
eukprot:1405008-Alexandrium_andersonii.AAC.1